MSRTDAVTRILFEAFSTAEVRLFYVVAYAAIAVFFYGVYVQIRKYRRGAALKLEGSLWRRLGDMTAKVLNHRTIARRDTKAGGAHRLIFYGFLAALPRHLDDHAAVRHSRAAVRNSFLAGRVLFDLLAGARCRRRRPDRRPRLHDVPARLAQAAEARLCAAGPLAGRSGFRPAAISARRLGLSLDLADHRRYGLPARGRAAGMAASPAGCMGYALVVARSARSSPRACGRLASRRTAAARCAMASGGFTGCSRSPSSR